MLLCRTLHVVAFRIGGDDSIWSRSLPITCTFLITCTFRNSLGFRHGADLLLGATHLYPARRARL